MGDDPFTLKADLSDSSSNIHNCILKNTTINGKGSLPKDPHMTVDVFRLSM